MDREELTPEESLDLEELLRLIDTPAPAEPEPVPEAPAQPEQQAEETPAPEKKKEHPYKSLMIYLHDLTYLICGIILVFLLCLRVVVVSGSSMYDTLVDGDYLLLANNVLYREPQAGDIVVINKFSYDPNTPIIKRIIATEGQTVDIDFHSGTVYVDGKVLEEDYIYTRTTVSEGVEFPLTVKEGCVFVLGDNRGRSKDSRNPEIGLIDEREIVGRVLLLVFPGYDEITGERALDRIGVVE